MSSKSGRSRVRRILRLALLAAAVLVLAVAIPYTWARVRADANAVRIIPADSSAVVPDAPASLRVGCYNIAHVRGGALGASNWDAGTADERRERLQAIGELVRSLDLDILVLNEVDFDAAWSLGVDQAAAIATAAEYPFVARQRNVDILLPFATLRFGNAILSRFPIESAELITLPPVSRQERIFGGAHDGMVARIDLGGDLDLDVVAVHLESRSRPARIESVTLMESLVTQEDVPVLLMGDFNSQMATSTDADPNAIERFMNFGRHQLIPNPANAPGTFPSEDPSRTIDWIMAPRAWTMLDAQVVRSDLSDHLPVVAEFRLPATPDRPND